MFISKISIKNFRSIKDLEIEPNNLCALVGANSSGKTNILKAIDLVLGEGWTTKAKVARELFNDENKEIVIELFFKESLIVNYTNYRGNQTDNVNSIRLVMKLKPSLEAKITFNNGNTFYGQEAFKQKYSFIYIPAIRNLKDELRVSEWTMLGKMMKTIHNNYIDHKGGVEELKNEFANKIQEAKLFLEDDFNDNTTFKKFIDSFVKNCGKNSLGLANSFQPKLNIYNLNWFYKTLQIQVAEDGLDKIFDAEQIGSGMQNLIMIAIFQTYAELNGGNVIFGIEEPEIYLYPNAQRALYDSFIELSTTSQIFYTTHNQNFVDGYRAYDVQMINKPNELGTKSTIKNKILNEVTAEKQKFRIYTQFNTERNELFFAKKIMLVEGSSDKIMWSTIINDKWNINLNNQGISIIECGGKNGVVYFAGVCQLLGLSNYFAVWDKDEVSEDKYGTLKICQDTNIGLEINPNLDRFIESKFLNIKIGEKHKAEDLYNWAKNIEVENILIEFTTVKKFLMNTQSNETLPKVEIPQIEVPEKNIQMPF